MIQHTAICREISKRWREWEYLYIDLCAGPGYLTDWPDIQGSPIIALDCMQNSPFRAIAFEEDREAAFALASKTDRFTIFGRWPTDLVNLSELPRIHRCGLIYADPNTLNPKDLSLIDVLKMLTKHPNTEYCDILLHIPATTWKRVKGAFKKYAAAPNLANELKRIGKPCIKLSAPDGQQQWIFALLTKFNDPGFGKSVGWNDIDSPRGKLYLDRVTMTAEQLEAEIPQGWLFRSE